VIKNTKNTKNTKPRALELKRETVVHLARELLKDVAAGASDNSLHPSQCVTWCAADIPK
jgi:hypothetical protein